MKSSDFQHFEYFSPNENWGEITKIKWEHVYFLNFIRNKLKEHGYDWPFNINCSYEQKGHLDKSWHKKGKATDGYFRTDKNLLEQYIIIDDILIETGLINFMGVGVYPDWNNPGFHLDNRGEKLHWIKFKNKYIYGKDAVYLYLGLIYNGE